MKCPRRSCEVPVRSCEVLGVHVTSCEYMKNPERFLEVLGDPGGSWGPWKSREVLGVVIEM